jgi:hypothetical protein
MKPNYFKEMLKLKIKSINPKSFNEKIQYKMAYDRRDLLIIFADKIQSRKYIESIIGLEYLPKMYYSNYDLSDIEWQSIPKEFAFKVNHGSGGIIIVSNEADQKNKLPKNYKQEGWTRYMIHPTCLIKEDLIRLGNYWLTLDYSWYPECGRGPEWAYKKVKRGVLFEELLKGANAESPVEYKFHMLNGECQWINVIHRNFKLKTSNERKTYSNVMTSEWKTLDLIVNGNPPLPENLKRPIELENMITIAEKLTNNIDYLRVDFYLINNRIVVGELTNYPMAGKNIYNPEIFGHQMGKILILDKYRMTVKTFLANLCSSVKKIR